MIGISTNVIAEATSVLKALIYCQSIQIHNLVVESDSLGIVKMLKGE